MNKDQGHADQIREAIAETQENIIQALESEHTEKMSRGERDKLDLKNERREQTLEGYRRALQRETNM